MLMKWRLLRFLMIVTIVLASACTCVGWRSMAISPALARRPVAV